MMMLNATYDAGADLILHAFGIMGSFNVYSYEKYILDEECARYALHMCRKKKKRPEKRKRPRRCEKKVPLQDKAEGLFYT